MSIPPLVCSTPPPPDQCEEDKDPDDFDIPYNLSQDDDDDDEEFGYGDFSSYNHYQSNCVTKKREITKDEEIGTHTNINVIENNQTESQDRGKKHDLFGTTTTNVYKPKGDEDSNIEDLGLEITEKSINSSEKDKQGEVENSNIVSDIVNETTDGCDTIGSPSSEKYVANSTGIDNGKKDLKEPVDDPLELDEQSSEPNSSSNNEFCKNDLSIEENSEPIIEPNLDGGFGDFDDFQFVVSSERKVSDIVKNYDNPWDKNQEDSDCFGNFTANFDSIERNSPVKLDEKPDFDEKDDLDTTSTSKEDDDFDGFKSSAVDGESKEVSAEYEPDQNMSVFNFHAFDSEHHVMESITKVLTSVFEMEISEPETEFKGKLELMLSETWGHLRETDVRQPYIINWNNSLAQKTLLRALCIDSRNILFGPKWGYNMPKYAVNLNATPLQPQKPLTPSYASQTEIVTAEKPTAKSSGWTDPFTADGQESCNTESEGIVEVTAPDLDVFDATVSTKTKNIYSSTLNVQPLRQISLPDTHIFTPTDSETPTSKTVHYDSGPPILLPQTVLEGSNKAEVATNDMPNDNENDDYWEFQDFKSSSEKTSTTKVPSMSHLPPVVPQETKTDTAALKPNVTYQTQVLQPIRMEPLIPTVNWPDPGEIKETFDDFSDFVSNSAWDDKPQEQKTTPIENVTTVETDVLNKIIDKHKNVEAEKENRKLSNKDYDDDFDTFQSALPPKHVISEFNFDKFSNVPSQNASLTTDFNNAFPKNSNVKSEIISVNNPVRQNKALKLAPNQDSLPNFTELTSSKSSIGSSNAIPHSLLQPVTNSNFQPSQSKQKTDQILQPLSLESYSQINWPNPGIDLQDLSRFNPVETLQSLKSDLSVGGPSKLSSPVHNQKNAVSNQAADDDIWGEFVSSKPKQQAAIPKKPSSFVDDDEWTDFVSSPSVKPQNGLNTISLNVHTNSNTQKSSNANKFPTKNNQIQLDIPTLNYITPKASGHHSYNDRHFQNL